MLYFYLRMHQNAFGGPQLAWIKGEGRRRRRGKGKEESGRTPNV